MKTVFKKLALMGAITLTPMVANGATLEVTLKASHTYDAGATTSPFVTMRFANNVDYTGMAAGTGPGFGQSDFVDATWSDLQNMAFPDLRFPNPPLTQAIMDTTTVEMGIGRDGSAKVFAPETARFGTLSRISWRTPDSRAAVDLYSDVTGRFSVSGNWDSDGFSDSYPWRLNVFDVQWNASATSFAVTTPDVGVGAAVPLPAGGILLLSALGALTIRRRQKST